MKKSFLTLLASLVLTLVTPPALWAAQPRTPERVYRLAMVGTYPDSHPVVSEVLAPWLAEIALKTGNRLIITYYAPNVLLPESANIEAVRKNSVALADQAIINTGGRPI